MEFKRPIIIITINYLIGILWGLYLKINITPFIFVIIIIYRVIKIKYRPKIKCIKTLLYKKNYIYINVGLIILIFVANFIQYKENKYNKLYSNLNEIEYSGIIISEQENSEYYKSYIMKVSSINSKYDYRNTNIIIKINKKENINLEYGTEIKGIGEYQEPSESRNYKGFNYKEYLKTINVYGTCKSNAKEIEITGKNKESKINTYIFKWRMKIKNNLSNLISNKDNLGIALAYLIGDKSFISDEQKDIFSNASLSHILAISGMHVTYVIAIINFILKKIDSRISKILSIIILFFFAELTGGTFSVYRAVIMSSILILSKLIYRKSDTLNNIAISCLILIVNNPYCILNLGFQLSFLGTMGIVMFNKKILNYMKLYIINKYLNKESKIKKVLEKIIEILSVSISANILIMPVIVYKFNSLSIVFLFSNILITPLLGLITLVGYFVIIFSFIFPYIANKIVIIFNLTLNIFNLIASISNKLYEILNYKIVTPNLIIIMVYYVLLLSIKVLNKKIIKKSILIILIITLLVNILLDFNDDLQIKFVDVGQGDCTLVITEKNKKILIDGGGNELGEDTVGKNILLPYLLDRKIKKLDYIIVSHFDSDHVRSVYYM